jgi:folate-binding protein YgfZ
MATPGEGDGPLTALLGESGAVFGDYHGRRLARHFGDPAGEYEATTTGLAVFDRSHRTRLRISGRAPGQMLGGVVTGALPQAPTTSREGVTAGRGTYHAVLTPKGRMISDGWLFLTGAEEGPGFLMDVPVSGRVGLLEHFARSLPPRLAKVQDVSADSAAISVVGPEAAAALSRLAFGIRVEASELEALEEGEWRASGSPKEAPMVVRSADIWPPAWTVYGATEGVAALWRALVAQGGRPAGLGVWSTLRVEAGRPAFGTDMDERTLPPEAGIVDRAIDQTKGCYTGQEVMVRIRDRGHVNRLLRRVELGDVPAPAPGTELLAADESGKVVGEITSSVESPRFGGAVALAYVRRGVERARLGGREIDVS